MHSRTLGSPFTVRLATALVLAVIATAAARAGAPSSPRAPRPAAISTVDFGRRLDVNRMSLVVTNLGSLGFELSGASAGGLWYPRDSNSVLLFASGLWLGAIVDGATRVTVAEYSQEYLPGPMSGGGPGEPWAPEHRVWKVVRWTGNPQDSARIERAPGGPSVDVLVHDSWSAYMAGAVPNGAPWRLHRLPASSTPDPADSVDVPGPDVTGDQMTWCVFNDADPAAHTNDAGNTWPLGAEVEQIVFAFADPGPLGDVAFVRWRVRNRGPSAWTSCRAGFWSDPDLGGFTDDKVACDPARSLGFAYNGDAFDDVYGWGPPVLGTVVLGSTPPPGAGLGAGMHAFRTYINGTDPASASQSYACLSGLQADGSDLVDPFGTVTRYQYAGDPLLGSGWPDPTPLDKRMMTSLAPRDLAPGDSIEVWAALVVSPGPGLTAALSGIGCRADYVRAAYASGFARPFPPLSNCDAPRNCPRSSSYWEAQCAGGGSYTTSQLQALASLVDQTSASLSFASDPLAGLCATLAAGGDPRQSALREYAAFLANFAAASQSIQPAGELPVVLSTTTPVSCPDIPATDVAQLVAKAAEWRSVSGTYQNLNFTHRRALEGVNWGGSGFNGGVDACWNFFGSTLDPIAAPDSFPRLVRLKFDHAVPQKAYRYLRYQQADGSSPVVGRVYAYAGHVDVPFTAHDVGTGELLEVAFVEKVVTDAAGVILPPESQPASYDGTWGPTAEALGDREYLVILRRPYTPTPRPEFAVDGAFSSGGMPGLFALWARLRTDTDVIDDGDEFDFGFDYAYTPGVDAILRDLAGLPPSDPDVAARYQQIADCLGAINRAETVGPTCDEPTAALVSLVSAEAGPDEVRIEWLVTASGPLTIERRTGGGDWSDLLTATPAGDGRLSLVDRDVEPGTRYEYRLRLASGHAGDVTIDVPSRFRLSLAGLRPNPATGPLAVDFTLASSAPARLEVLDVAGRRVHAQTIERPTPGRRVLALPGLRLAPGVYALRLEQGGVRMVARSIVLK